MWEGLGEDDPASQDTVAVRHLTNRVSAGYSIGYDLASNCPLGSINPAHYERGCHDQPFLRLECCFS